MPTSRTDGSRGTSAALTGGMSVGLVPHLRALDHLETVHEDERHPLAQPGSAGGVSGSRRTDAPVARCFPWRSTAFALPTVEKTFPWPISRMLRLSRGNGRGLSFARPPVELDGPAS